MKKVLMHLEPLVVKTINLLFIKLRLVEQFLRGRIGILYALFKSLLELVHNRPYITISGAINVIYA